VNDYSPETQEVLRYIKSVRRFDPELHAPGKFHSVLAERLNVLDLSPGEYLDELQVRPAEIDALISAVVVNRALCQDEHIWHELREQIAPKLASMSGQIRLWAIDCRNGLDAYALAVLFAEAIGVLDFLSRVKIFATDEDDANLAVARLGMYRREQLSCLDDDILFRYFTPQPDGSFAFRADLRRVIIFGRHSLFDDAPISRMDLVSCRYVLCKQDLEKQQKAIARLLFSLKTHGNLIVGKGEVIPPRHGLQTIENEQCIYRKMISSRLQFGDLPDLVTDPNMRGTALEQVALDSCGPAQIVIDAFGAIAVANLKARTTFGITPADIGKPLQDLELSYRPLELRSLIEKVVREQAQVHVPEVTKMTVDGPIKLEVYIKPLLETGKLVGTSVQYIDVSAKSELFHQVAALNDQLQAANEEVHSAHEELMTTNEELQSTNEELETTNEELQSTNEELETMNEELRSTNSELESTNYMQREVTAKLEQSNRFLSTIVDSFHSAIILLNTNHNVIVWNERAVELWGVREEEVVQRNIFSLDIGFPVESLKAPLRKLQNGGKPLEYTVPALNRRGKSISCKVRINALAQGSPRGFLVVISDGEQ
jgi:two-component system CheB/CheR fusion protein